MRIIAGEFRRRHIKSVPGLDVRPTPDRLRESLFNVLAPRLPGAVFVDAYAGTGAVGIEALSRGASQVVFLEKDRRAAAVIRENLSTLGASARADVRIGGAAQSLAALHAGIVFLDPPYPLASEYDAALAALARGHCPLVIVQHSSRHELPREIGSLRHVRLLRQGDNSLSFYERHLEETSSPKEP